MDMVRDGLVIVSIDELSNVVEPDDIISLSEEQMYQRVFSASLTQRINMMKMMTVLNSIFGLRLFEFGCAHCEKLIKPDGVFLKLTNSIAYGFTLT